MIISHKHQFIFIKTKKTAGTSIEIVLSSICGNDDIITPIEVEDEIIRKEKTQKSFQNIYVSFSKYSFKDWLKFLKTRKRLEFYNHMPAKKVKRYLQKSVWDTYYKFCFERDPIAKTISHFNWLGLKKELNSFEDYLSSSDVLLIKGDRYYKGEKEDYLVDNVYKMEEMKEAFSHLSEKLCLDSKQLEAPDFITKPSEKKNNITYNEVKEKYGKQIKSIFKTEYKDFYN